MFILGARGFSWAVSVFSQVFKVTRAFFLFFLFSYFSFLWIDPRFFSRPTPGESSSSHARKKLWYPGLEMFSQADILPNGRYVIRWAALCCFCFFGGRSSFISSLQIMQNFLTFSPATKRLKNNWAKATSSSRLFVCRSNFPAVYCWSHFTGYCKRYWRIRNLRQSESVKYLEWILSDVMFRSCRTVSNYVSRSRISGLRLGHEFTFLFLRSFSLM